MANYDYQYELRFNEGVPDEVRDRSYRWRKLRDALGRLLNGDDDVTVYIDDSGPKDIETRIKAAVYTWSNSPGIELKSRNMRAKAVSTRRKVDGQFKRLVYVWLEHVDDKGVPVRESARDEHELSKVEPRATR